MSNITQKENFKYIIIGGFLLSLNAGYIAANSLAGLHQATVSHVTGDIARTGVYLVKNQYFDAIRMTMVWVSFIVGSGLASMIVSGTKVFSLRRTYGWALILESAFLFVSFLLSNHQNNRTGLWWSENWAALACGMQNALCTTYSGAVIRTTHMTGTCTDIGLVLGHEVRIRVYKPLRSKLFGFFKSYQHLDNSSDKPVPPTPILLSVMSSNSTTISTTTPIHPNSTTQGAVDVEEIEVSILWKLRVLLPLLAGFLIGAVGGSSAYLAFGRHALLGPGVFIGVIGLIYALSATIYKSWNTISRRWTKSSSHWFPSFSSHS